MIRLARPSDLAGLADIERSAGKRFLDTPMAWAAGDDPVPLAALEQAQAAGLLWIAEGEDGQPAGFALTRPMARDLYLAEMAVSLPQQGRGLGRALLLAVRGHARAAGYRSVVLTTDRELPWNAPFYRRHGFSELPPSGLPAPLAARLRLEAEAGFDPARRCAMACPARVGRPVSTRFDGNKIRPPAAGAWRFGIICGSAAVPERGCAVSANPHARRTCMALLRACLLGLATASMLLLSACVNREPQERAAFIQLLQSRIESGTLVPLAVLSEPEKEAIGDYADAYEVIGDFQQSMGKAAVAMRDVLAVETLRSVGDIVERRPRFEAARKTLAENAAKLEDARARADKARASQ